MTLLITVFAAVISTVVWYVSERARTLRVGTLCLMYWGASLMWLVDAAAEYFEERSAYFTPSASDMLNDAFLGLSADALGLVIWLVILAVKDPEHTIRSVLMKRTAEHGEK